jgi:hypothetical protein
MYLNFIPFLGRKNIPLCCCTTHCLPSHLLTDVWVAFTFLLKSLFYFGYKHRLGVARSCGNSLCNLWGTVLLSSIAVTVFYWAQRTISPHFGQCWLLDNSHPGYMRWNLFHLWWNLSGVEHRFVWFWLFGEMTPFLNWVTFVVEFEESFIYSGC